MTRGKYRRARKSRHGIVTIIALVTLAVVGSTVMLITQTIVRERRYDAGKTRLVQADQLSRDMIRITEARGRNLDVTIPKTDLDGIVGLRLESSIEKNDASEKNAVTVRTRTLDDELPTPMRFSLTRSNQPSSRIDAKQ